MNQTNPQVRPFPVPAHEACGVENAFGTSPRYEDLRRNGLDFSREPFAAVIGIGRKSWQHELALHDRLFEPLAYPLPSELTAKRSRIARRLGGTERPA